MKTKIKRGYCYTTTDKEIFTGEEAKRRADEHQKYLMMEELKDGIEKEARKILIVPSFISKKRSGDSISEEEEVFMKHLHYEINGGYIQNFECFVDFFTSIILLNPTGMEKLTGVIRHKFEQLKV